MLSRSRGGETSRTRHLDKPRSKAPRRGLHPASTRRSPFTACAASPLALVSKRLLSPGYRHEHRFDGRVGVSTEEPTLVIESPTLRDTGCEWEPPPDWPGSYGI